MTQYLECPDCGGPMRLLTSDRYFYHNGNPRKWFGCMRWPDCKGTHTSDENGAPLGIPGDRRTRQARILAHNVFDAWWRSRRMKRSNAYKRLKEIMGMSDKDMAHIGKFTAEQCFTLIEKIARVQGVTDGEDE